MKSNQSLLKNTIFLYGKVVISIFIAFFSTRLLNNALGSSDYGLYNIVAGFILLLTSIRSFFSSSIQRFINVANGRDDTAQMNSVFNLGIVIHIAAAIVVVIIAETIGLWYINEIMVIDAGRLVAANYVYQFSIVMAVGFVLVIPFEALIVAHERLKFYAINTTIEMVVKLFIVIGLAYASTDKLILYAFLLMLSTVLFRLNIVFFVLKNFKFYTYSLIWDKPLFKQLANFSGWNFLGHITYILSHQGINLVLNTFGGTIINASQGFSYQIMNALNQFVNNLVLAISPKVMSGYESEKEKVIDLLAFTTKFVFFVVLALITGLFLNLEVYLKFWLTKVPDYTAIFTILILIYLLIKILSGAMNTIMLADGDLKKSHTWQPIVSLLIVPIAYLLLMLGYPYYSVFIVLICAEILKITVLFYVFKTQLKIPVLVFFKKQFLGPLILSSFAFLVYISFKNILSLQNLNLIFAIIASGIVFSLLVIISYFIGINKRERLILIDLVNKKILKK